MTMTGQGTPRPLHRIADDIARHGGGSVLAAAPYIDAMRHLATMQDRYGHEDAEGIIVRFLVNAASWKGPEARRLKAELRAILNEDQA